MLTAVLAAVKRGRVVAGRGFGGVGRDGGCFVIVWTWQGIGGGGAQG